MLQIGQQWDAHLPSYEKFPPLQAPDSYSQCQFRQRVATRNVTLGELKMADALPDDDAKREALIKCLKARAYPQDQIDDYLSVKFGDWERD
jgi:hypothetical protein